MSWSIVSWSVVVVRLHIALFVVLVGMLFIYSLVLGESSILRNK